MGDVESVGPFPTVGPTPSKERISFSVSRIVGIWPSAIPPAPEPAKKENQNRPRAASGSASLRRESRREGSCEVVAVMVSSRVVSVGDRRESEDEGALLNTDRDCCEGVMKPWACRRTVRVTTVRTTTM